MLRKNIIILILLLFAEITMAQTSWVKYGGNPVLPAGNPGSWDQESFMGYILHEDSLFKMWYCGWDGSAGRIGYAISSDEVNWTKVDSVNPVLDLGLSGDFDNISVEAPCVIYDDGMYKMWYNGYGGSPAMNRIGYATSADGVVWAKADSVNPILGAGPSPWDNGGVWSPHVVIDEGQYKMWYVGWNGVNSRIGYATSIDGIRWIKADGVNPILNLGSNGSWDDYGLNDPAILLSDSIYQMWYMGHDGSMARIGYAVSGDGTNWVKDSLNPVLTPGSWNSWDDSGVRGPEVLFENNIYKMWYTGIRHGDYVYGAGYAAGGCFYDIGDANGSDSYNGLDITYGVAFFKGGLEPLCPDCPLDDCNSWHYCGDVNGSCTYNGLDITYGVAYFKGGPAPIPCPDCPPVE